MTMLMLELLTDVNSPKLAASKTDEQWECACQFSVHAHIKFFHCSFSKLTRTSESKKKYILIETIFMVSVSQAVVAISNILFSIE